MKKGQRVRIEGYEDYKSIYNGKIGVTVEEDSFPYVAINGAVEVELEYFKEEYLTPVEPSIDTLVVGDVIEGKGGNEFKVLAMQGDVFLRSRPNHLDSAWSWFTKQQAKDDGYTFSHHEDGLVGARKVG